MTAPARIAFPPVAAGLRVGLLGGSFNPPHQAHRALSLFALKRLQLDRVWWLVSPGNPLKDTRGLPPLQARIAAARAVANDPRIVVTGLEALIRTRYTIDTIAVLRCRFPAERGVATGPARRRARRCADPGARPRAAHARPNRRRLPGR